MIEGFLARGGASEVYVARSGDDGGRVALKLLLGLSPADRARADREARIAGALSHPNINRLIEHGELGDDGAFLAFEHLAGETLAQRIARGPLSPGDARALTRCMVAALDHAHARTIVHRDLKPANVPLVEGDCSRAQVLDFGLAHTVDALRLTIPGRLLGTPAYMAPEQIRGERTVDPRLDLWSLGVMLFEALSGALPFDCDSIVSALFQIAAGRPCSLRDALPTATDALVAVIDRALTAEIDERFADARSFGAAIEAALDSPQQSCTPALPVDEVRLVSVVVCDVDGDRTLVERLVASVDAQPVAAGHAYAVLFGIGGWRGDEPDRAVSLARSLSLVCHAVSVRTERTVVRDRRVAREFLRGAANSVPPAAS